MQSPLDRDQANQLVDSALNAGSAGEASEIMEALLASRDANRESVGVAALLSRPEVFAKPIIAPWIRRLLISAGLAAGPQEAARLMQQKRSLLTPVLVGALLSVYGLEGCHGWYIPARRLTSGKAYEILAKYLSNQPPELTAKVLHIIQPEPAEIAARTIYRSLKQEQLEDLLTRYFARVPEPEKRDLVDRPVSRIIPPLRLMFHRSLKETPWQPSQNLRRYAEYVGVANVLRSVWEIALKLAKQHESKTVVMKWLNSQLGVYRIEVRGFDMLGDFLVWKEKGVTRTIHRPDPTLWAFNSPGVFHVEIAYDVLRIWVLKKT